MTERHIFRVSHDDYGTMLVEAESRPKALFIAAKWWHVKYDTRLAAKSKVEWAGYAGGGKEQDHDQL